MIPYHLLNEGETVTIRREDRTQSLKVKVDKVNLDTIWFIVVNTFNPSFGLITFKKDDKLVDDTGKEILIINRGN